MNIKKTVKAILVSSAAVTLTALLVGCADTSSYNTRNVTYKHHGRVKVVNKTNCVNGNCQYVQKKVKHKGDGKTVVVKKNCDDQGNCYKTKHHHW
jgi:hypothetical protein